MLGTIDSKRLEDIADAIREKLGNTEEWKPSQMPDAIRSIEGGYSPVKIVSWAEGTNTEIAAMIDADRRGVINLHDYWTVGDERIISLTPMPATITGESHVSQQATLVLMDSTCKGFKYTEAAESGSLDPKFIVGFKGVLNNGSTYEGGYINASSSNSGGWAASKRREWCNDMLFQALPLYLQNSLKEFTWKTFSGSSLMTTSDFVALTPEKAIMGAGAVYSTSEEAALYDQWEFYVNDSNKIKYVGSSAAGYFTATIDKNNGSNWSYIGGNGTPRSIQANAVAAISAFGCI